MIQVLAVFYSVLIAFVIVGERSAISEANDYVAAEAGAMSALFHRSARSGSRRRKQPKRWGRRG
jgi:hypothetical protein